jgi:lipopolysaccharide/colanic/teichoic acid biosynthesis glycosyltransferase/glycosyltransferase involved in cell wall biosynthesis
MASAVGLIMLAPLFALVAVLIRADSPGGVFFRQERIGKGFRPFAIYKFRTMVKDAPLRGGLLTAGGDSRITRVGKILRHAKIDELPQLLNVLRGEMSLVGPRPEVRRYVELFRENYKTILSIRPGITDLASLKYRDESAILAGSPNPEETYIQRILPDKLALGEEYVRRSSVVFDLVVIYKTVAKLVLGRNSDEGSNPEKSSVAYRQASGMKPRLLFVIDEDRDFCTHRLDLGRAAREAGFEVLVATHVQRHAKQIEEEGFKLFPMKLRRGVQSPFRDLAALIEFIRLYRREKPDVIHHVGLKQVVFGGIAARIVRAPAVVNAITGLGYLVQSEGWLPRLIRSAIMPALRWVLAYGRSAVILQNESDCDELVQSRMVKRSRVVVIRGAGVNVSQFCPSPEPNGVPVVVLASRMLWTKGVGEFVQAAQLLKSNGIHVRCVLAGAVDKENPGTISETQLRRWAEDGVVEWWGQVDDMAGVFEQAQVVVLPTYYGEGLPKVLLEAAACGKPLITTRVRGCTDIVRDGENGLLVAPKDHEALAQAVTTLIQSKALRDRMGARGRDIVMSEFTIEQVAAETIAVYRGLL